MRVRVNPARRGDLVDTGLAVRAEETDADGWLRLEVTFQDSRHAEWALWQLAENAEAPAPRWLRNSLRNRAAAIATRYRVCRPESCLLLRAARGECRGIELTSVASDIGQAFSHSSQWTSSNPRPFSHPIRRPGHPERVAWFRKTVADTRRGGSNMSSERYGPGSKRLKRRVAGGVGLAAVAGVFVTQVGPFGVGASSHREAPLIAGDPRADNTDVYAFVSPDKPENVTLIANWIPFEEPNGGPNFYPFADDTRYNIKVDNSGDAVADLTYTWVFDTVIRDADGQFLYNTGPVTSLDDPDLNVYQTYDLTVTDGDGTTTVLLGNGDGVTTAGDPIAAPSLVGPASIPDYAPVRDQATYNIPDVGITYVGQADDPFFADLRVFDLLYGGDASLVGSDTLAGYNVNTIALQVPSNSLALNGDAARNPVIGVWSTTERRSASVAGDGAADDAFVQVSRLGNPLVNEAVVPLSLKDAFNAISPDMDADQAPVVAAVLDPILPHLVEAIYGVPAPAANRNDLFEIFLTGICMECAGADGDPATVLPVDLNSLSLNADAGEVRPSEMLRLNMSIAPTAEPNPLGVLAGDVAGFPNGRRLTDDVLDITIQAAEGAAITGELVAGLATVDSVDANDAEFGDTFPYVALPHNTSVNAGSAG